MSGLLLLYCARSDLVNIDSARQSRIEASKARVPNEEDHSQIGKADEEDRFCKVVASQNSPNLTGRGILAVSVVELPQCGLLRKDAKGFVYVALDDRYIHELVPEGFEEPPYFGDGLVGAHISVMSAEEGCHLELEELGCQVEFCVERCEIVHPPLWAERDLAYLIIVEAPALDLLRERYGLPPKEYPFHITIGRKHSR
jgi:hypothetical protein